MKKLLNQLSFLNISKEEVNEEIALNIKKEGRNITRDEGFDLESKQDCFDRKDIISAIKNIISKRN